MVDPIKVTILSPGLSADGIDGGARHPAPSVVKFLSSRRIEIEKTGLYSFLVLFSMGITQGQVEHARHRADQLQGSLRRERAAEPALCRPSRQAHPEAYGNVGLKDLCDQIHRVYREDDAVPKAQREMYTVLPEMALRPADAYDRLVKGQGRKRRDRRPHGPNACRDDRALSAGHSADHARRTDHRRRRSRSRTTSSTPATSTATSRASRPISTACASQPGEGGRRYLVDCVIEEGDPMIPRDVKAPTVAIPFHKLLKVVAIVDRDQRADQGAARPDRRPRTSRSRFATASPATSPRMPRSAPISARSRASGLEEARKFVRAVRGLRLPHPALGARRFPRHLRHRGCSR